MQLPTLTTTGRPQINPSSALASRRLTVHPCPVLEAVLQVHGHHHILVECRRHDTEPAARGAGVGLGPVRQCVDRQDPAGTTPRSPAPVGFRYVVLIATREALLGARGDVPGHGEQVLRRRPFGGVEGDIITSSII